MFIADEDMAVIFGAIVLEPDRVMVALVAFDNCPGARQRMVYDGDFVMENVGVGLVDVKALGDDGFAIVVERNARRFI